MEILYVIAFVLWVIVLIVFLVMAANIGTIVGLLRSLLVSQDTTRKLTRIQVKLKAGIELTDKEKALLQEPGTNEDRIHAGRFSIEKPKQQ